MSSGFVFCNGTGINSNDITMYTVNLVTASISNPISVIWQPVSGVAYTSLEVVGATYNQTTGVLYTLIHYVHSALDYYILAETKDFNPNNSSITLDSRNYTDITSIPTPLGNLVLGSDDELYSANSMGNLYKLTGIGAPAQNLDAITIANSSTVGHDGSQFFSVYNVGAPNFHDVLRYFTGANNNVEHVLENDNGFNITSVAYNPINQLIYYYTGANKYLRSINKTTYIGKNINTSSELPSTNPVLFFAPMACIHNSSKILMANGSYKLVTDVTSGDELFSPDCKTTTVKEVVPCWLNVPNNPYHKCIVFEKDSLAPNMPNERFIIDPTHPMSTLKDYECNGLVVAKDFVNGKTIYKTDYKEVQEMFPENMKHNRYDIVLTKGDTYVANNVVVKSRVSFKNAGYDLSIE